MGHVYLSVLIEALELMPQDGVLPHGFGEPISYRGYYEDLAFLPVRNAKVSDMLAHAKGALGKTFEGYKGGDFTMHEYTAVWIAEYGTSAGDKIGPTLINMWRHSLGISED